MKNQFEIHGSAARNGLFYGNWQAIEAHRASGGFGWTVMTGARGALTSGARTGRYRLGGEETLFDRNGSSYLSREDFAIAVVDMAEDHVVSGTRVAVGRLIELRKPTCC